MNNVYFGIFLGIIICFGSERILWRFLKIQKERKESEQQEAEERLEKWFDKKMGKPKIEGN